MAPTDRKDISSNCETALQLCHELQRLLSVSDGMDESLLSARIAQALECAEDRARALCGDEYFRETSPHVRG
jgi:hypothetical protein